MLFRSATITDNATVTVSKGEVVNAGAESAKVKISLGKQTLSDAMLRGNWLFSKGC